MCVCVCVSVCLCVYVCVCMYIYIYIAHILRLSTFCTYKVRERKVSLARKCGEKHGAESLSVCLRNCNLSECSRNVSSLIHHRDFSPLGENLRFL